MTQKEKELLIKDLCARLPYGVIVHFEGWNPEKLTQVDLQEFVFNDMGGIPKPYLRPMESMTEEECDMVEVILGDENIFDFMRNGDIILKEGNFTQVMLSRLYDYFDSIHVDYRGLIPKGLALEAKEGMYIN